MIQTRDKTATPLPLVQGTSLQRQAVPDPGMQNCQALKGEHLYALLLKLRAQTPGILQPNAGQLAHAALLSWFGAIDEELATGLHTPDKRRPFTCSCLWEAEQRRSRNEGSWSNRQIRVSIGQVYWLRITLLSESLFRSFMARYLQAKPLAESKGPMNPGLPQFQLGQICFDVVEMLSAPTSIGRGHEPTRSSHWSGHTTYQDLVRAAQAGERTNAAARTIGLEFCSPTAFSDGQGAWKHQVYRLPSPDRVFGNLAQSWNAWAPAAFRIDQRALKEYCHQWVDVSEYSLSTDTIQMTHAPQRGFLGWCVYTIMEKAAAVPEKAPCDTAQEEGNLEEILSSAQILHLLHAFAFYAGVGTKTTMGMGQVRAFEGERRTHRN